MKSSQGQCIRADVALFDPSLHAAGVVHDAVLVIENGTVVDCGAWPVLAPQYAHLPTLQLPAGSLLLPGLVNAHHHGRALDTRQAGMADAPLELWLPRFVGYPTGDTYAETQLCAARMLLSGITTSLHAHSHPGPRQAFAENVQTSLQAYRDIGVRVAFAVGHYDQQLVSYLPDADLLAQLPEDVRQDLLHYFDPDVIYLESDAYFELFATLVADWQDDALVRLLLAPVGLHWASDGVLARVQYERDRLGVGVHMHLLETPYQAAYAHKRFGTSAVAALHTFGLLSETTSFAHGVWADERDIQLFAKTGATVVTNASSNLRLGSGVLPLMTLAERGVPLAMGTDSMSLFGTDDLLAEMTLLQGLHHPPYHSAAWLSAYQAFEMATVGGTKASTFADIGKLLPGYQADAVVLDMNAILPPWVAAAADKVALTLAKARANHVRNVFIAGEQRVRDGKLVGHDIATLEKVFVASLEEADATAKDFSRRLEPHLRRIYRDWL